MSVRLADATREHGGKAHMLARLVRGGFPVPQGIVFGPEHVPEPADIPFPGPWIVRSSAVGEDSVQAAYPGLYTTVGPVGERDLARAAVSVARLPEAAVRYAAMKGVHPGRPWLLVQPWIDFEWSGVAVSPDLWSGKSVRVEGSVQHGGVTDGFGRQPVPDSLAVRVADLVQAVRAYLKLPAVDVEWGYDGTSLWIVQARPLGAVRGMPERMMRGLWRADTEHNPRPVSPLHADVIDRLDIPSAAWNGWVYYRVSGGRLPDRDVSVLEELMPEAGHPEETLRRFGAFASYYLSTRNAHGDGIPLAVRVAVARLDGSDADYSCVPVYWDVASPVWGDVAEDISDFSKLRPNVTDGTAEGDDLLFARALHTLSRALRSRARTWYPDAVRAGLFAGLDLSHLLEREEPAEVLATARSRMSLWASWHRWTPPDSVRDGIPEWQSLSGKQPHKGSEPVCAVPGRVRGAVHVPGSGPPPEGPWIAVARQVTVGMTLELLGASGLVLGSSSLLSHGVLLARELGIPTVVGYTGWYSLKEGMIVELSASPESVSLRTV